MADQHNGGVQWTDDSHASTEDGFSAVLQRGRESGRILISIHYQLRCIVVKPADKYEEARKMAEAEILELREAMNG